MARNFDGSGDYLSNATQPTALTDNLCVSAWLYPTTLPQAGFFWNVGEGGVSAAGFGLGIHGTSFGNAGDRLTILFPGVAWRNFTYQFAAANAWYHVLVGIDSGTWRAWVNGAQDATTHTDSIGAPSAVTRLGARSDGTLSFTGRMAEAALFAAAPTQALASQLAAGMSPAMVRPRPARYWPLYGRHSPEIDPISALDLTATNTTAADHPRIFLPRNRSSVFVPSAGGGGGGSTSGNLLLLGCG